jgi:GNAT superfamily N-acetyltransferase
MSPSAMAHQRFHLELPSGHEVPIVDRFPDGHAVRREMRPEPGFYRMLYTDVGRDHTWTDRAGWTDEQWRLWGLKPQIQLWVLWAFSDPAGFFELRREDDDETVEIAYFGLRPAYVGKGLAGRLMGHAVAQARAFGATRIWLHTCTKDHPRALPFYQSRGFRIFKTEDID